MIHKDYILNNLPQEPENYFRGFSCLRQDLPSELVLFIRRDSDKLNLGSPILHDRYNLLVNLGGEARLSVDFQDLTFKPGQALLLLPRQVHIYKEIVGSPVRWGFAGFDFPGGSELGCLGHRPIPLTDRILTLFRFFIEHYRKIYFEGQDSEDRRLVMTSYMDQILREMKLSLPAGPSEGPSKIGEKQGAGAEGFRRLFTSAVRSQFSREDLSVGSVAEIMGYSVSALHKKSLRLLGITPGRFIEEMVLAYAADLLNDGVLTVGQVSYACGYRSCGAFSRAFKRHFGTTPKGFRDNMSGT